MQTTFESISVGQSVPGPAFEVSRETIREFCDASLDYNPLHLDDTFMEGSFGRTRFGGVIMHGMTNFGLITRMLTDWAMPIGGVHRRLETRWRAPVKPGDTIRPQATVSAVKVTQKSRWVLLAIEVANQRGETVATGEAMVEFPVPQPSGAGA
jgi:3-hydroxybutyryl-CoA dehydratase